MTARLLVGDALTVLRTLPDTSVRCCITSPPYWGLRDYGVEGQIGLERTPEEYVEKLVAVFREVRRVLMEDGTLWLNLGDCYASTPPGNTTSGIEKWKTSGLHGAVSANYVRTLDASVGQKRNTVTGGLKPKDLAGIPWRVAFALQANGWWLRSDIIWSKPNPMPQSVKDRPTRSHEYVFLLSKSARYFYDAKGIAEDSIEPNRVRDDMVGGIHRDGVRHSPGGRYKQDGHGRRHAGFNGRYDFENPAPTRNARSVWTIATQPYPEAHFATFPEELARRCILAGSVPGDMLLDPFGGSGTVAAVAVGNGRSAVSIELNPAYIELQRQRIGPMPCEVGVTTLPPAAAGAPVRSIAAASRHRPHSAG